MLETNRLKLRSFSTDDFDDLLKLRSNKRVMEFLGGSQSAEAVSKRLDEYIQHYEKHGFAMCPLIWKETDEFIGVGGLKFVEDGSDVEVGYMLKPEFWRRGIATEVTVECLRHGFEVLKLERIIAQTVPANKGSRIVMEKCGMRFLDTVDMDGEEWIRYVIHANPENFG